MEKASLVLTVGWSNHSTLKTPGVSILTNSYTFSLLCVFAGKRDIGALPVKCYIWSKCEWQGTVSTLEEHMAMCKFALVPCPNLCKTKLIRKNLDSHLNTRCPNRNYSCQYCGEEGTYATITQIHDKTCRKKVISCPNKGCTETMQHLICS